MRRRQSLSGAEQSLLHASPASYPFRGEAGEAWRAQASAKSPAAVGSAVKCILSIGFKRSRYPKHFDKKCESRWVG